MNCERSISLPTSNSINWECPLPRAKEGLGVPYMTYASGRIGASVTHWGGLHQIAYYGIAPESASPIYFEAEAASSYARLFRFQVCIDGNPYNLELHDTYHYPFGYLSRFAVESLGVEVRHRLTLLNDAVVFSLEVLSNTNKLPIQLYFEHHGGTRKSTTGNVVRTWSNFVKDDDLNALTLTAHDAWRDAPWQAELDLMKEKLGDVGLPIRTVGIREGDTSMALFGQEPLTFDNLGGRLRISSEPFTEGAHAAALLFASSSNALRGRIDAVRHHLVDLVKAKEAQYDARLESVPAISADDPILSSYFTNAPGISETLIVEDRPGAMRASSMHYWVWAGIP